MKIERISERKSRMLSSNEMNAVTRNILEENRLNLQFDFLNHESRKTEVYYRKSISSIHDFVKRLSESTGTAYPDSETKQGTLDRVIFLDKLLSSGPLNSFSERANNYLKKSIGKDRIKAAMSTLNFDDVREVTDSEDDDSDVIDYDALNSSLNVNFNVKPVVKIAAPFAPPAIMKQTKLIRPLTHVVRTFDTNSNKYGVAERFKSKSAQQFKIARTSTIVHKPITLKGLVLALIAVARMEKTLQNKNDEIDSKAVPIVSETNEVLPNKLETATTAHSPKSNFETTFIKPNKSDVSIAPIKLDSVKQFEKSGSKPDRFISGSRLDRSNTGSVSRTGSKMDRSITGSKLDRSASKTPSVRNELISNSENFFLDSSMMERRHREFLKATEPYHLQTQKQKDPVFAKRYKLLENSKLSGRPANYDKDDAIIRVAMYKSAINREKKRIIASIKTEKSVLQQLNLAHRDALDKDVKAYLKRPIII